MSEKTIIRQFIIDNFLFGNNEGLLDTDLLRQKGIIDSTGVLELIAFVEKTFSLTIDDLEIIPENLDTIERIALFVQTKKSGGEVATLAMVFNRDTDLVAAPPSPQPMEVAAVHE